MGIIGGELGYRLLRWIGRPDEAPPSNGHAVSDWHRVEAIFGPAIWDELHDKVVIDFGCGTGQEAVEIAEHGARRVIGLDIRESVLEVGRRTAAVRGVSDHCRFVLKTTERADAIISIDAFEHFDDPAAILRIMDSLLRPTGKVYVSFGPPWYHPRGGHLFSMFPWAHLLFTERALIRWRAHFRSDQATRFQDVEGGLNLMTVRRFEQLVERSPFRFERFETVPIGAARRFASPLTREFLTSIIKCTLVKREASA